MNTCPEILCSLSMLHHRRAMAQSLPAKSSCLLKCMYVCV